MDWIDINTQSPNRLQTIWVPDINGDAIMATAMYVDDDWYARIAFQKYQKISKWATYDVIY